MHIGQRVLAKYEGKIQEFNVIKIWNEDLELSNDDITITRKFWEIRPVKYEEN